MNDDELNDANSEKYKKLCGIENSVKWEGNSEYNKFNKKKNKYLNIL